MNDAVTSFLTQIPAESAFARADLSSSHPARVESLEKNGAVQGVVVMEERQDRALLQPFGDPAAIRSLLDGLAALPNRTQVLFRPEQQEALSRRYQLSGARLLSRMELRRENFRDVRDDRAVRLTSDNARELEALLSTAQDAFLGFGGPVELSSGVYYGVRAASSLVACAGTRLCAPDAQVAALGNVFTAVEYRGLGLGTATTAAVAREALAVCRTVVLNVDPRETRAVRVYRSLGFTEVCALVEATAQLKDA